MERRLPDRFVPGAHHMRAARIAAEFISDEVLPDITSNGQGAIRHFGKAKEFSSWEQFPWGSQTSDEGDHQLWRLTNSYMRFIHPLLASSEDSHLDIAVHLVRSFVQQNGLGEDPGTLESTWNPYAASQRVLNLTPGVALQLDRNPNDPRVLELFQFVRRNVAFVLANVEWELRNNHVERNLAALSLFFELSPHIPSKTAKKIDRQIHRIMKVLILPDGTMCERSAMYQSMTVLALSIFACSSFLSDDTRGEAETNQKNATHALSFMTHPDGEISLFNDSWTGETPRAPAPTHDVQTCSVGVLENGGFLKLDCDPFFLLMDAGPIGPRWNPGHGHADFLSIELDYKGERLFVDPGTSSYSSGPHRQRERSARAHNGPFMGREPVDFSGSFRAGRLVTAELSSTEMIGTDAIAVAGVLKTRHGRVARVCVIEPKAKSLIVADAWVLNTYAKDVRATFLLPHYWDVLVSRGTGLRLSSPSARTTPIALDLQVLNGDISLSSAQWSSEYLTREAATAITVTPKQTGQAQYTCCVIITPRHAPDVSASIATLCEPAVRQALHNCGASPFSRES